MDQDPELQEVGDRGGVLAPQRPGVRPRCRLVRRQGRGAPPFVHEVPEGLRRDALARRREGSVTTGQLPGVGGGAPLVAGHEPGRLAREQGHLGEGLAQGEQGARAVRRALVPHGVRRRRDVGGQEPVRRQRRPADPVELHRREPAVGSGRGIPQVEHQQVEAVLVRTDPYQGAPWISEHPPEDGISQGPREGGREVVPDGPGGPFVRLQVRQVVGAVAQQLGYQPFGALPDHPDPAGVGVLGHQQGGRRDVGLRGGQVGQRGAVGQDDELAVQLPEDQVSIGGVHGGQVLAPGEGVGEAGAFRGLLQPRGQGSQHQREGEDGLEGQHPPQPAPSIPEREARGRRAEDTGRGAEDGQGRGACEDQEGGREAAEEGTHGLEHVAAGRGSPGCLPCSRHQRTRQGEGQAGEQAQRGVDHEGGPRQRSDGEHLRRGDRGERPQGAQGEPLHGSGGGVEDEQQQEPARPPLPGGREPPVEEGPCGDPEEPRCEEQADGDLPPVAGHQVLPEEHGLRRQGEHPESDDDGGGEGGHGFRGGRVYPWPGACA